jgi:hypothetical protein
MRDRGLSDEQWAAQAPHLPQYGENPQSKQVFTLRDNLVKPVKSRKSPGNATALGEGAQ